MLVLADSGVLTTEFINALGQATAAVVLAVVFIALLGFGGPVVVMVVRNQRKGESEQVALTNRLIDTFTDLKGAIVDLQTSNEQLQKSDTEYKDKQNAILDKVVEATASMQIGVKRAADASIATVETVVQLQDVVSDFKNTYLSRNSALMDKADSIVKSLEVMHAYMKEHPGADQERLEALLQATKMEIITALKPKEPIPLNPPQVDEQAS